MPNIYNDGGMVFGSQVVSINSVNYVAEQITLDFGSDWAVRNDEGGVPTAQHGRKTVGTGSMTLQLASVNTVLPPIFSVVIIDQAAAAGNVNVIITKVGQAFDHGGETKVPVDIREKLS